MTRRKPAGMSYRDWVEVQVREAEQRGAFADLPGKGKPIPDIDRPRGELDWIAGYLSRENVDLSVMLPPSLALAKEVEVLPQTLLKERTETRVRAIVEDLNERIRKAHLRPQEGPPLRVWPLDIDPVVEQWRDGRAQVQAMAERQAAESAAAQHEAVDASAPHVQRVGRWGWLRRLR